MKKHFYFAAMALAVMSSCSNDDVVDNPSVNPIEDGQPVAIELGVSAPQAMVTTKGLGTVGGIATEDNKWKGQKLYVVMLDSEGNEATEGEAPGTKILDNTALSFQAPDQTTEEDDKTIKILKDASTVQAKYYPNTGAYSFYGYHIDNIQNTTPTFNSTTKTVSGITITGTEDLMAAKTKGASSANYPTSFANMQSAQEDTTLVAQRAFSAWTARRGIQPILQFNHLLTRLQFNVIAGNQEAAASYYDTDETAWKENKTPETLDTDATHQNLSTAVKINAIRVVKVKTDNITIDLGKETPDATSSTETAEGTLTLMGTADLVNNDTPETQTPDGNLDALTATSPLAYDAAGTNYVEDGAYPKKTPVGESIMLLPGDATIDIEIDLSQLVVDTEDLNGTPLTYAEKSETLKATLNASDIKTSGTTDSANKTQFLAGESYSINITVYSYQRIKIDAELTPWKDGGEINITPGDQF